MKRLLAPVTVAAVIALLAGCAPVEQPARPGSASPTTQPTSSSAGAPGSPRATSAPPAEIPLEALLQATDVGTGYTTYDDQLGEDHGSIAMIMSYCGHTAYSMAAEHELAYRKQSVGQGEQSYVHEEVTRYEATWAARHLNDLRGVLPRCQTVEIMGDPNNRVTLTVVGTNFTGDESILLIELGGSGRQYHAVVRQGTSRHGCASTPARPKTKRAPSQ